MDWQMIVQNVGPYVGIGLFLGIVLFQAIWKIATRTAEMQAEQVDLRKDFTRHQQNADLHYDYKAVSRDFVPRTEYADIKASIEKLEKKIEKLFERSR